ncbi:hypothetical protein CPB84DRAFT_1788387 [Gymnopilus junonius]|uniref:F-box domain-containing protein n=1 Tax=Gymnopilus junonius TaxID=109634 RepID=A0A9P5TIN2_GYMJU|nr:hypothetical protein CPB84DRAFT_1788387 [Gymnopilus junonius]
MAALRWLNPVRRRGTEILTPIPTEIYLEIFDHVRFRLPTTSMYPSVRRDLFSTTLVCHLFRSAVLPLIFEELTLYPLVYPNLFTSHRDGLFCEHLLEGGPMAEMMKLYTKTCALCNWDEVTARFEPGKEAGSGAGLYSKVLNTLSNIHTLSISSIIITKDLLRAMGMLLHLKSLSFEMCLLSEDITEYLENISSLELKSLGLQFRATTKPALLECFICSINYKCLIELSTDNWQFCERMARGPHPLLLEYIKIDGRSNAAILSKLLSKTPVLCRLHIACLPEGSLKLDPGTIPNLKHVVAPVSILNTFVPGRPISIIEVIDEKDAVLQSFDLEILRSSSCPITDMRIPSELYEFQSPFWGQFSYLQVLRLDIFSWVKKTTTSQHALYKKTMSDLLRKRPKQLTLHTLQLEFMSFDAYPIDILNLRTQYTWLTEIVFPQFPALRQCQFDKYFQWFYCAIKLKWEPEVLPATVGTLLDILARKDYKDIDLGGFLARLVANSRNHEHWLNTFRHHQ